MDDVLEACLRGDQKAWEAFVGEYARVIFAGVRHVLGRRVAGHPPDLVEEITQEVFVKLVRNDFRLLRGFDPKRASLVTYLTIVARTTSIDVLRRKRLSTVSLDESRHNPPIENDAPSEGIDIPAGLMTPRQELVLTMLFDRDMEMGEVAKQLGIDIQTVRSTKHKAINKLRKHYGHDKEK